MNGQFAQLAAMQPQAQMGGMPPAPPPQPGPVGGRLAQLWEAFKTDPNMRQAVLQASTAMMQSAPPGQNSFGMIGAGIQHGANTLDKLRERDRSQGIDEERYAEQTGLKRRGVDLQERGLEENVTQREADREARQDDRRRDRRFQSLLTMNAQDFQSTERDLDRQLQRELSQNQLGATGRQSTHPTVHLATSFGQSMYEANPSAYDSKATAMNTADGGSRTGLQIAVAEQVQIQNEASRFVRSNPDFYNQKAFEARLGLEGDLAGDPIRIAILQEMFADDPEQLSQILEVIATQTPAMSGRATPGRAPRPPIGEQSPWPAGEMNPLVGGDARGIPPPGGREIEQWRTIANAGVTVRNEVTQNPVRLTYEGNTFYFIEIDRTTGKELGRQAASTPEIQAFVKASGR